MKRSQYFELDEVRDTAEILMSMETTTQQKRVILVGAFNRLLQTLHFFGSEALINFLDNEYSYLSIHRRSLIASVDEKVIGHNQVLPPLHLSIE